MVETERLIIIPLSYDQLNLYLQVNGRLEKMMNLNDNGRTISPDVREMVSVFTLPKMKKAKGNDYLFFTFWIVVEKSSRTIVAELGFKGEPNAKGEIEIGYGTLPGYRGKGFMTEAVGGMIGWAKQLGSVKYILAETDEKNIASVKIVQKNNFQYLKKKGKMLWWRVGLRENSGIKENE
ncbi:MAG: N-acetyltransferase [Bacteroidetes bacterium]|nr:MAG: N-acetyltransferase [Bacteroidota bacterium]